MRDGCLAVAMLALFLFVLRPAGSGAIELVSGTVSSVALAWRRQTPELAVGASSVAFLAGAWGVGEQTGAFAPLLIAIYSAIAWGRPVLGAGAAVVDATVFPLALWAHAQRWDWAAPLVVALMLAVIAAAGLAVHSRRATLAAVRERVLRAEQMREVEAARRVAEERVRIARELHDVLGHHVAIINVHAGVAEQLLERDPQAALKALHHVQDATGSVLTELAALVEVLREPDDSAQLTPTPGMADLDQLLSEVRTTGLSVRVTKSGPWPPRLAPLTDLVAFRVIQESLTNARKYGSGGAELTLATDPQVVRIEVSNRMSAPDPAAPNRVSGGQGLRGLRERVDAVGGVFDAGSEGLVHRTRVVLPQIVTDSPEHPAARPNDAGQGKISP